MAYRKHITRTLLVLFALPVLLFGVALAALQLEATRRYVGDRLIGLANGAMDWRLVLSGYERLNPWGVRVEHVLLYDDYGRLVVDAHGVDGTIDLWKLLYQTVDIGSARVDRALLTLPMVTEPDPPKEKKRVTASGPDDDTPSGWRVKIPSASVGDCRLDMPLPIGQLRAHARDVDGEFHWHDSYQIVVRQAALTGDLDGRRTLTAKLSGSDWKSDTGGEVSIDGQLGEAPLAGRASLSGLDVNTPWPQGTLHLQAKRLTPATLALFRVDPSWLARAVDLTVDVQGDQQGFHAQSALSLGKSQIKLAGQWTKAALQVWAHVPKLQAHGISKQLPAGVIAGKVALRYALGGDGVIETHWQQLVLADVLVPDGQLRGFKRKDVLAFEGLTLAGYQKNLSADGQLNLHSKALRAHAHIQSFDLAKLHVIRGERLQGVVDGELHLSAPPQAAMHLQGKLQAQRLRVRGMQAERVTAQVTGQGTLAKPELSGDVRIEGLNVPKLPLQSLHLVGSLRAGKARAQLQGKGKDLNVSLELLGEQRTTTYTAHGRGKLEQKGDELMLSLLGTHDTQGSTLRAQLSGEGTLSTKLVQNARGLTVDLTADDMDLAPLLALAALKEQAAQIDGSLHVEIPNRRGKLDLQTAAVRADLTASVPLAPLLVMATPTLASLSGTLEAKLRAEGTLAEPHAELQALAKLQLPERNEKPEQLVLDLAIAADSATGKLVLSDLDGTLLTLRAELGEPIRELLGEPSEDAPLPSFELSAQLEPRRLDLMQGVIAYLAGVYAFDLPLKLAGKVSLSGKDNLLQGDAALRVRVFGDAIDQSCTAGAFTDLDVSAELQEGALKLRATGYGDKGGKLTAELATRFELTRNSAPKLEPATLEVVASKVGLATLPGLCALAGGLGTGKLSAQGIGSTQPTAQAELAIVDLRAGRAPPLELKVKGSLTGKDLSGDGSVHSQGKQAALLSFKLPLQPELVVPNVDLDKPAQAMVKLRQLPVSPFLSVGEQLGRPRGTIDGELHGSGPIRDPKLDGYIELKRVGMSIASIAQPLRDVAGRIEVHGRKLSVRGLSARDGEGTLHVDGLAQLAKDWSGNLKLEVSAQRFPVRRQGEVVGELTTKAGFNGKIDSQLDLTGEVRIREGRFWLTGQRGSSVQPLDRHAEIHFVDAQGKADEQQQAQAEAQDKSEPRRRVSLTQLHVRTDKDVWFQHSDFSVQLGIDMKLLQEDGDEKLVGEVRITRGQLELIGKPFDIERGSVRLTGDYPPDPELELKASFEPPAGQKLYVEVHGRASSPIVTFSGAASTAEEAVAIVSGLSTPQTGAEQQAQSDARGFATNITAGLLSATARRRLGDWVPLISVQSDVTGAPAQARAGFDASKLIPPFLRPLARGAYVEGIVGDTRQNKSGTVGLGVRLEVALPRDFVSSMGYGPGPTWATDLSWVP